MISGMDNSPHDAASFAATLFLLETTEDAALSLSFAYLFFYGLSMAQCTSNLVLLVLVPLWFAAL